jgi:hypothetical protein
LLDGSAHGGPQVGFRAVGSLAHRA